MYVTGAADSWSGWGIEYGDGCGFNVGQVTAGVAGVITTSTFTPGCSVPGCQGRECRKL